MKYLSNAFSLQMLDVTKTSTFFCKPISIDEIPEDVICCIGHPDTAKVVGSDLGRDIAANRVSIHLEEGDILYVAQLTGGRLPEGTATLPDGFSLSYLQVTIMSVH